MAFSPKKIRRLGLRTYLSNLIFNKKLGDPSLLLRQHNIPYYFVDSHNSEEVCEILSQARIDILLLYGTKIIKPFVLEIPRLGTLNSHSALLPKYRGGKSEFWILFNNEPQYAGVTIHWVVPGLDAGDIFLQEPLPVEAGETPKTLREKSVPVTGRLFVKAIKNIEEENIIKIPQNESEATSYRAPTPEQIAEYEKKYGQY